MISSRKRAYGGSGSTVTPKLIIEPTLPRCGERGQRGEHADHDEADATVARERERQPDERCPGNDRERRPRVDEAYGGPRGIGPGRGGARESHRERDARGEADDGGGC